MFPKSASPHKQKRAGEEHQAVRIHFESTWRELGIEEALELAQQLRSVADQIEIAVDILEGEHRI